MRLVARDKVVYGSRSPLISISTSIKISPSATFQPTLINDMTQPYICAHKIYQRSLYTRGTEPHGLKPWSGWTHDDEKLFSFMVLIGTADVCLHLHMYRIDLFSRFIGRVVHLIP
jgi:hypothetical protein